MTHSHARSGFSLMELILYMGIVALISGGLYVTVSTLMENARKSKTETNMQLIKSSIDSYHARNDEYPKKLNELKTPRYLAKIPKDGWGNAFVYKLTEGSKHPYKLYSYGKKGPGGGETLGIWDK